MASPGRANLDHLSLLGIKMPAPAAQAAEHALVQTGASLDQDGPISLDTEGIEVSEKRLHAYEYVTLEERENALVIHLNPTEDAREKAESLADSPTVTALQKLLEDVMEKGQFEWIHPEEIAALTDAPILGRDVVRDKDGEILGVEALYWHERYQIDDPIQDMLQAGQVRFMKDPLASMKHEIPEVHERLVQARAVMNMEGTFDVPGDLDLQGIPPCKIPLGRVDGLVDIRKTTRLDLSSMTYAGAVDASYTLEADFSGLKEVGYWAAFTEVDDIRVANLESVGTLLLCERAGAINFDNLKCAGLVDALDARDLRFPVLSKVNIGVFTWSDDAAKAPYMPLLKESSHQIADRI